MIKKIMFIFLCIFITACDRQPNDLIIRNSLEKNIKNQFEDNLFSIEKLIRRGSAVDSKNSSDKTRKVIYYDVILKIHKNIDTSVNMNHFKILMDITGSGARGIIGMKPHGNHEGDLIKIHASAIFSKKNGYWEQILEINDHAEDISTLPNKILT